MNDIVKDYLIHQEECLEKIKTDFFSDKIKKIFGILINARDNGNRVFVMGNGGSASTASHFVADLLKTSIVKNSKRFQALSLSDNIPVMLAWANDFSYDDIFVGQLENFLEEKDIVVGISSSGNSNNVIRAAKYANDKGAHCIALTGKDGGKLSNISATNLTVPSNDILTIETMHLMTCHLLIAMIRESGTPFYKY